MYDGRVVQMGTPQDLFDTPEHTFVGYFIGSPGMNLLEATVEGNRATVAGISLPLGASYGAQKGRVQIGIRPEFVSLTAGEGLPVTIRRIEDVGRHRIVRADFNGTEINAIAEERTPLSPEMTRLAFAPDRIGVYADDWRVAPQGGHMGRAA
jgi:glycerol transport system ATP-binding protein